MNQCKIGNLSSWLLASELNKMPRLPITKTPKVYVGGAFIRSESARVFSIKDAEGNFFANIPQCTRKDLRNAVEAAAKAGPGWAKRTAYNRGQILYRLGEMLEARASEMAEAIAVGGVPSPRARREVAATVDRLIYYAGWTDKYEQVLGNVNPVAAPYFNFTVTEPMGIVGVIAPDEAPLLRDIERMLRKSLPVAALPSFQIVASAPDKEPPHGVRGKPSNPPRQARSGGGSQSWSGGYRSAGRRGGR